VTVSEADTCIAEGTLVLKVRLQLLSSRCFLFSQGSKGNGGGPNVEIHSLA
jgi:hypothetical protein